MLKSKVLYINRDIKKYNFIFKWKYYTNDFLSHDDCLYQFDWRHAVKVGEKAVPLDTATSSAPAYHHCSNIAQP